MYNKINSNDAINDYAKLNGITEMEAMAELYNYGFLVKTTTIKESDNFKKTKNVYDLSAEARKILQSEKTINQHLKEQKEKENLAYKDSHFKVHKLNPAQFQSFTDAWKRHWMTIAVAFAVFVIAFLTYMFVNS